MTKWKTALLALAPMVLLIVILNVNIDVSGFMAKRSAKQAIEQYLALDSYRFRLTQKSRGSGAHRQVHDIHIIEEQSGYETIRESYDIETFLVETDELVHEASYIISNREPKGEFYRANSLTDRPWVLIEQTDETRRIQLSKMLKESIEEGIESLEYLGSDEAKDYFRVKDKWPVTAKELEAYVPDMIWSIENAQRLMAGNHYIDFALDKEKEEITGFDLSHSAVGEFYAVTDSMAMLYEGDPSGLELTLHVVETRGNTIEIPPYVSYESMLSLQEEMEARQPFDQIPEAFLTGLLREQGYTHSVEVDDGRTGFSLILYTPFSSVIAKVRLSVYLDVEDLEEVDLYDRMNFGYRAHFPVAPPFWSDRLVVLTLGDNGEWQFGSVDKASLMNHHVFYSADEGSIKGELLESMTVRTMRQVSEQLFFLDPDWYWREANLEDARGRTGAFHLNSWKDTEFMMLDSGRQSYYLAYNLELNQVVYYDTVTSSLKLKPARIWYGEIPEPEVLPEYSEMLKLVYDERYFAGGGKFTVGYAASVTETEDELTITGHVLEQGFFRKGGAHAQISNAMIPVSVTFKKVDRDNPVPVKFEVLDSLGEAAVPLEDRISLMQTHINAPLIEFMEQDFSYSGSAHLVLELEDEIIVIERN